MMTESGVVTAFKSNLIQVQVKKCHSVCSNCQCGAKFSIASLFGSQNTPDTELISVKTPKLLPGESLSLYLSTLSIGDQVLVGYTYTQLLLASLMLYLLPLLVMILCAFIADIFWPDHELMAIFSAILGFGLVLKFNSYWHQKNIFLDLFMPILIRK